MRDPVGRLRLEGDVAIRELQGGAAALGFLQHPVARALVEAGQLVPFHWRTPASLESPRLPFVSLPTEWSDAQFGAAARLTLDVAERALAAGFELKDASAWNVVFDGVRPMFCDHLSFEPLSSRQWWAFGQFCRHFVLPLAVSAGRGLSARESFLGARDGLSPERARRLLGLRGLLSPVSPLLRRSFRGAVADSASNTTTSSGKPLHGALIRYARWSLPRPHLQVSAWTSYVGERGHYGDRAAVRKRERVDAWLREVSPRVVLDLGCNTGEFSRIALAHAGRVIGVDADPGCIETMFLAAGAKDRLHPFVADVADLHGGRGWGENEFPGLIARLEGRADLLMMLAFIHHLRFGEGIPLPEIAALAARLTSAHLILETVGADDAMVVRLARQRRLDPAEFTVERQLDAFDARFELIARAPMEGTARELVLMKRRP